MPAEIACLLVLVCGQVTSDNLIRLPPPDEAQPAVGEANPAAMWTSSPLPQYSSLLDAERVNGTGVPSADALVETPAYRMTAAWLAGGGANGFGMVDFDFNRTWLVPSGPRHEPLAITPGFGLHLWSDPPGLDLPSQVFDLYLDFSWRAVHGEQGGLSVGITPGFYGDFERPDGDTFQLTGWMLGNYRLTPEWNVLGGVALVRQLESQLLPIGGLVWTPNDDLQIDLLIPRPRVAWRITSEENRDVWCYVAGQFGGGAWAVADSPTESVLVGYNDLRLLLGMQTFHVHGREFAFEIGYVFDRELSVNDVTVSRPDGTFVLQASAAY